MWISSASMTIRSAFERRSGSKRFESFANRDAGTVLANCARCVVGAKPSGGTNHPRNDRITTNRTDNAAGR